MQEVKPILDRRGKPSVQTINDEPSVTVQSDAHLADIENIMRSFGQGGMQMMDDVEEVFADVSEFGDYHDVMIEVKRAETTFLALPSKVREIFDHSVHKWLDTAHDKDKREAMVAAGFIKPIEESTKRRGRREGEGQAAAGKTGSSDQISGNPDESRTGPENIPGKSPLDGTAEWRGASK